MNKKIILVNGVPRSGTSAVGAMLGSGENCAYRFQPMFSYLYREISHHFKGRDGLRHLISKLESCNDSFILNGMVESLHPQQKKDSHAEFMIIKHVRYHEYLFDWLKNSNVTLLCLIRDPRACIYSQISIKEEWKADFSEESDWLNARHINNKRYEYFGFYGWLRFLYITERLKAEYPDRVQILKYENFSSAPLASLENAVTQLSLPLTISPPKNKSSNNNYDVTARSKRCWRDGLNMGICNYIENSLITLGKEEYLCD